MSTTIPAPTTNSKLQAPRSAVLTPLALAALTPFVSADDVRAYLEGR
jgi:hypothetical protein